MRYTFEAFDAENFLNPGCYYVGAMFKDGNNWEDQIPNFMREGIWILGWGDEIDKYVDRLDSVKKGDIFIIKRLLGKGSSQMKVLAAGVVVGKQPMTESIVNVEWSSPKLDLVVPLKGEIGTISLRHELPSLPSDIQIAVKKCQARFLRWNLNIVRTTY